MFNIYDYYLKGESCTIQSSDIFSAVSILHDSRIVIADYASTIKILKLQTSTGKYECVFTYIFTTSTLCYCIACFSVNDTNFRMICGTSDYTLKLWNLQKSSSSENISSIKTLEDNSFLNGHTGLVLCVSVLPDGRIISGSTDTTLKIWNTNTGMCDVTLIGHSAWIRCVAIFPNNQSQLIHNNLIRLVSGSDDNTLKIWNVTNDNNNNCVIKDCDLTLIGHNNTVWCVAILQDYCKIVSASGYTLKIWNALTGQCLLTLIGHTDIVSCVSILPNGQIVSGSHDKTIKIWNPLDGTCESTFNGHTQVIKTLYVFPDGRLVSAGADKTIRIWS